MSPDEPVASCRQAVVAHPGPAGAEPTMAVRGVDADVHPGEFVAVVGPSGSGKSTLLHTLAGFTPVTSGEVRLLGRDITSASTDQVARIHRDGVGFVFQSLNLVPSLPVIDNVTLPARFRGDRVDNRQAEDILTQLGLGRRIRHRTSDLSGGEQQRAAVARVLFQQPAVLFADEPTGALDTHSGEVVMDCLQSLARAGSAVLLVTHDREAAALADRTVVMRDGLVEQHLGGERRIASARPESNPSEACYA